MELFFGFGQANANFLERFDSGAASVVHSTHSCQPYTPLVLIIIIMEMHLFDGQTGVNFRCSSFHKFCNANP